MRMIDDDEVGLKEKSEDTRYMKRLHRNKNRSTGSVGKLRTRFPTVCHYWKLKTRKWAESSLPEGPWEGMNPYPGAPPITGLLVVGIPHSSKDSLPPFMPIPRILYLLLCPIQGLFTSFYAHSKDSLPPFMPNPRIIYLLLCWGGK